MYLAIKKISSDFGPDAVLLNTRKVKKTGLMSLFSKPYYEILVGYDPSGIPSIRKNVDLCPDAGTGVRARKEGEPPRPMGKMTQPAIPTVPREKETSSEKREGRDVWTEVRGMVKRLREAGVADEYIRQIRTEALSILREQDRPCAYDVFFRLIEDRIPVTRQPSWGNRKKTVLLLGPTGAGKTTSVMKLVAKYSKIRKMNIGVVNADTSRMNALRVLAASCPMDEEKSEELFRSIANEQLKIYLDLLGISYGVIFEPEEIVEAKKAQPDRDLLLIDTTGMRPHDPEYADRIQTLLRLGEVDEVLLVLSASSSFDSCKDIIESCRFLNHYGLLVTKIDEVSRFGTVLNLCCCSGKPLHYLASGRDGSDEILSVRSSDVARRILRSPA